MKREFRIVPSLLSMNFSSIERELAGIPGNVKMLHLDIMDGVFVDNITFGPVIVKHIRENTKLLLDTHLMIKDPDKYIEEFRRAGSDMISFHIETAENPSKTIDKIKSMGMLAGIALNPETSVDSVIPFLDSADYLLVMSVHPGFAGQAFIEETLKKVETLKCMRGTRKYSIEIDGGINRETSLIAKRKGADWIVSGSYLFSSDDFNRRVEEMLNDQ